RRGLARFHEPPDRQRTDCCAGTNCAKRLDCADSSALLKVGAHTQPEVPRGKSGAEDAALQTLRAIEARPRFMERALYAKRKSFPAVDAALTPFAAVDRPRLPSSR